MICWSRAGADEMTFTGELRVWGPPGAVLDGGGVLTSDWINIYLLGLTCCVRGDGVALWVRGWRSCGAAEAANEADLQRFRSACFD